jgi:hypothetical protein
MSGDQVKTKGKKKKVDIVYEQDVGTSGIFLHLFNKTISS